MDSIEQKKPCQWLAQGSSEESSDYEEARSPEPAVGGSDDESDISEYEHTESDSDADNEEFRLELGILDNGTGRARNLDGTYLPKDANIFHGDHGDQTDGDQTDGDQTEESDEDEEDIGRFAYYQKLKRNANHNVGQAAQDVASNSSHKPSDIAAEKNSYSESEEDEDVDEADVGSFAFYQRAKHSASSSQAGRSTEFVAADRASKARLAAYVDDDQSAYDRGFTVDSSSSDSEDNVPGPSLDQRDASKFQPAAHADETDFAYYEGFTEENVSSSEESTSEEESRGEPSSDKEDISPEEGPGQRMMASRYDGPTSSSSPGQVIASLDPTPGPIPWSEARTVRHKGKQGLSIYRGFLVDDSSDEINQDVGPVMDGGEGDGPVADYSLDTSHALPC